VGLARLSRLPLCRPPVGPRAESARPTARPALIEWVGESGPGGGTVKDRPSPARVARYVGARARSCRCRGPRLDKKAYRWTAWDVLAEALRGAYGPYLGRWKRRALRRRLQDEYRTPLPTLVDGRMRREEWIRTDDAPLKIDFEHHNFGGRAGRRRSRLRPRPPPSANSGFRRRMRRR